MTYKQTDRRGP